jgi:hypothetical protein
MNNKMMLWAALLLGGFFLLQRKPDVSAGLIGVNTSQPGFGGFDESDPW